MTIQSQTTRVDYTGNGATTNFPVPFYWLQDTDLLVIRTDSAYTPPTVATLALTTDYVVTGSGNQSGGSITTTVAPTATQKLSILRNVPFTQLTHYVPNDPFPAASHEQALDKLTMETQQLNEGLSRSITLPPNATGLSTNLPLPAANNLIGWNQAANALQNVDPTTIATAVTYGNAVADKFSGDGTTVNFNLSANPGGINNLDVSISGVTQRPGIDYTWTSGTTLTFTSAPPSGTNNVLVRYTQALPIGSLGVGQVAAANLAAGAVTDPAVATPASPSAGISSTKLSFLQAGTSAVYRAVQDRMRDVVSVKDFGAKGDGVTDDTAAIQAAINASYGRTLYFPLPANFYYLNSASGLSIVSQIRLIGEIGTFIKYGSALSNTTDVITFNGNVLAVEGFEMENLWIVEASGSPARDVLRINLNSTSGLKKLRIARCMFRSKNGYAVNISNPSGAGVNTNGLFLTVIEKNELYGGIVATNLGDSVTICDNVITGPNPGVTVGMLPQSNPTGSSSSLAIERNNITATGGGIVVNPGRNVRIVGNNIEQIASLSGGYCVSLANIDWGTTLGASVVENNKFEAADGTAQCGALSMFQCNNTIVNNNNLAGSSKTASFTYTVALTSCYQVKILDNTIYASTNCVGVGVTDAATTYTALFGNRYSLASGASSVSDSGTGTKGIWKTLTYNTNWSRALASSTNLSYFKDRNSMVYLRGQIQKSVAITANDLVATLPSGFLPEDGGSGGNLRLPGNYILSGGGSGLAAIRVLSTSSGSGGQIQIADAISAALVSLDGLSFYSPDV